MYRQRATTPIEERFWSKVDKKSDSECWLWIGAKNRRGYGVLGSGRRANATTIGAHRISYQIHYGDIPDDYVVMHKCDNPSCVNPNHLAAGTNWDNVHDMVKKNRHPKGKHHGRAILTPEKVKEIKHRYKTEKISYRQLADEYQINHSQIYRIMNGINWSHIN